jgi:hypothetical protein
MKTINVTVCGIFQVDVKVKDPEDIDEVVEATQETLGSLNATLLNQHNDITPIFFTGGIDISDLVIYNAEDDDEL